MEEHEFSPHAKQRLNGNALLFRPMELGDVAEVAAIEQQCFSTPWSEESLKTELTFNGYARYFVAELAGTIVGYGGMWLLFGESHITNIAVHRDYRRQGIAWCILECLVEESEKHGFWSMTLEVRASNTAAQALYERWGFVGCGVRPGYYTDNNEDALIMWRHKKKLK